MATARARGRRTRARWSRPADVEAANETSVEAVNATVHGGGGGGRDGGGGGDRAEDAVDLGAESVTAMERGTKKAVEVETNAHSTMEM